MKVSNSIKVAAIALFFGPAFAQGALIGVTLEPFPDIFSSFLDVSYDASIDELLVSGFPTTYNPDGLGPNNITGVDRSFDISVDVGDSGVPTGGMLSITGSVLGNGPTLLTADLVDFGFMDPPGGEIFDFLFTVNGGDLAGDFGGIGAMVGVILDINDAGAFDGTFTSNFMSSGSAGVSDTGVPEPMTASLLGVMGSLLILRRRARA